MLKIIISFFIVFSAFASVDDKFVKLVGQGKTLSTAMSDGTLVNPTWVQEAPSGSGTAFAVSETPVSNSSVFLYRNKLILEQTTDYSISGKNITLTSALLASQNLYVIYQR